MVQAEVITEILLKRTGSRCPDLGAGRSPDLNLRSRQRRQTGRRGALFDLAYCCSGETFHYYFLQDEQH